MLHLTKIAFQAPSPETLRAWLESHGDRGEARLTTRYLPKRAAELAGGSLYWIWGHALVGRSPLLGFAPTPEGRFWIRLAPTLIATVPQPHRAHQGWRYLDAANAPADLASGDPQHLPSALLGELARLGLV